MTAVRREDDGMAAPWYFVDRLGQRHGPVDAATLLAAIEEDRVPWQALVWREGLPDWLPLHAVADELGLVPPRGAARQGATPKASGAVAPAPAGKPFPIGLVLGIGGGLLALLMVVAILAAIALPAYQEFTVRAKLAALLAGAQPVQAAVDAHVATHGECPDWTTGLDDPDGRFAPIADAAEALAAAQTVRTLREKNADGERTCAIDLTLGDVGRPTLAGMRLRLSAPAADASPGTAWACSDLDGIDAEVLPPACRR
jgi:type IV pilus assembly protein PilA